MASVISNSRIYSILVGGFRTQILEAGDRSLPTVLMVHDGAFGTDADLCWAGVIENLSTHFNIIAPDLLGWGGSAKVNFFDRSPYDFRLEHLKSICDVLMLSEPIFVIGSSFGAEIAVRGTAESKWGWNVSKCVAISGTGGRMFRVPGGIEQLSQYEPSLEAAKHLTSLLVSNTDGMEKHFQKRFENSMIPGHWEALSSMRVRNPSRVFVAPEDPWPEPLRTCPKPILFIEGDADPLLESGWSAKMAAIAKMGSNVVVQGGHEPNLDQPKKIAELCLNYFREI